MLSYLEHSIKWRKSFEIFFDKNETDLSLLIDKFTRGKNGHLFSDTKQENENVKKDETKQEYDIVKDECKKEKMDSDTNQENEDVKKDETKHIPVVNEECHEDNIKKFEKMIVENEKFPDVRKNPRFRFLYKKLLLKYHPDKHGGDETIFSNIREDVENKYFLFFIKYSRESFNEYYKDDIETWSNVIKSHIEKWKKIVYTMT